MAHRAALTTTERDTLAEVEDALYGNPFDDGPEPTAELASVDAGQTTADQRYAAVVVPRLAEQVERLAERGVRSLGDVRDPDRPLLEHAYLFHTYTRYVAELDDLIERQLGAGEEPVEVPFAAEAIADLSARGFSEPEAFRYLALSYQLRRGFFFIERGLIGRSPSMRSLRRALWDSAFSHDLRLYVHHLWDRMEDFSTLLLGETGTGKGAAAAAIGRSGYIPFDRRTGRFAASFTQTFVATNLSEFPESLIESELFGHRKGAFTGAIDNHRGLFERCSANGTLFLDEIGDVAIPVQIKLLQVLQERRFHPVGSHEPRRFEGRVVAATHRPIDLLRREGRFRHDFYYRLCSNVVTVPTLRQRIAEQPGELEELTSLLVERITGRPNADLTRLAMRTFARDLPAGYGWPGNVRELEQAIRRVLLTRRYSGDRPSLEGDDFKARVAAGDLTARELMSSYCQQLYRSLGSYGEVARRLDVDPRTVKKYVDEG